MRTLFDFNLILFTSVILTLSDINLIHPTKIFDNSTPNFQLYKEVICKITQFYLSQFQRYWRQVHIPGMCEPNCSLTIDLPCMCSNHRFLHIYYNLLYPIYDLLSIVLSVFLSNCSKEIISNMKKLVYPIILSNRIFVCVDLSLKRQNQLS